MLSEHFLPKYKDHILIKMLIVLGMFIVNRILSDSHRMKFACLFVCLFFSKLRNNFQSIVGKSEFGFAYDLSLVKQ